MNADPKLQEMQRRVQDASARNSRRLAERAGEARENAVAFVGDHPFTAIAGGVVAGAVLATLLPKRRHRAQSEPEDTRTQTIKWLALAADAVIAFAQQSLDSARSAGHAGQKRIEHLGERVSDGTAGLRKEIGRFADEATQNVRSAGEQASQQAKSVAGRFGSRFRR